MTGLEVAAAATLAAAVAAWWIVGRSVARLDRLEAGARGFIDDLRAARLAFVEAMNGVRAAICEADGRPVRRIRILPTGETFVPYRQAQVVLHLAWENGVMIPSACLGCAECGTCRVRVLEGLDRLPPKSPKEIRTLDRYTKDPAIRLSCLLRTNCDLVVEVDADQDKFPVVVPPESWVAGASSSNSSATSRPSSQ